MPGPVPKRSEERVRKPNAGKPPITKGDGHETVQPAPQESWHPLVKAFWASLAASGESAWYEPSDWMAAYVMCENMSRDLKPRFVGMSETIDRDSGRMEKKPVMMAMPIPGNNFSAYLRMFATLGITEGDRRRIYMELNRPTAGQPSAEQLAAAGVADLRDRLLGKDPAATAVQ